MYQNHENPSVPPGVEANQRSCPSQACLCHQLLPIENMSTHVLSQVCQHRQSPKINNNALQGDVSQPYISSAGMMRTYRAYVKRHKLNMTEILRHIFSIVSRCYLSGPQLWSSNKWSLFQHVCTLQWTATALGSFSTMWRNFEMIWCRAIGWVGVAFGRMTPGSQFRSLEMCWRNPKKKMKLDDGWPESVEEQGLLLLVWRHHITKQYIKDVIYAVEKRSIKTI